MANSIDLVASQEAIKGLNELISRLEVADKALLKAADDALKLNSNLNQITTPSTLSSNSNSNEKVTAQLKAQQIEITKTSDLIIKKAEQSRLAEVRLQQAREKAFDKFEANSNKEQAINRKNESAYQRIQNSVNALTKTYNDLAIRKQLSNTLSEKEERQLENVTKRLNTYQSALKKVDSDIQKNQRNVGNYASGWNGLGNSINQITRELPAFTFSAQTGFLALSNNIPILTDEIGKLSKANKALASDGKPVVSVFKQILSNLLSWQTAMGVGILLLTLYGQKVIDYLTGADKTKKSLEDEKKAIEDKNKSMDEARTSLARYQGEEISRSKILFETAKNLTLSYQEREKAVKDLQSRYPAYLGGLSKEKILAGDTAEAEELLNKALVNRGVALAAQQEIQKVISDGLKNEKKLADEMLDIENKRKAINDKFSNGDVFAKEGSAAKKSADERNLQLGRLYYLEGTINEQYESRKKTIQESLKFYLDQYNQNSKFLDVVKETANVESKSSKVKKEKTKEKDKELTQYEKELLLLKELEENVKQLEQVQKDIDDAKLIRQEIDKKQQLAEFDLIDEKIKKLEELKKVQESYLKSFVNEFASNSGFSETFKILSDEIAGFGEDFKVTFNAIAESAQETFNFISNASQANFEGEKQRLESQYELALGFAGDNTAAQAKLAEDLEQRKKEIANRENKAKQKQAIFNIAIDTAQGIISALASTPPNVPLSILIGALGALQIGIVASQQIPQYFDGGVHDGGLAMINDAGGSNYVETVVTPDGKAKQYKGRDVVTNLPKGTEIFTPEQWHEKQLFEMMQSNNVSMPTIVQQPNGMSAREMDKIMTKHFSKIQVNNTTFDRNGIRSWSESNGNRTIRDNNRVSRKGFSV